MKYILLFFLVFNSILPKEFSFPNDHSFHHEFGLEWCYFVGHLKSKEGKEFGYELSFFRAKISPTDDIYPVHFAISDISNKKHSTAQTVERKFGNLAGFTPKEIYSGDYSVKFIDATNFRIIAKPRNSNLSLDLELNIKDKSEILIHGENGYSKKSRKYPEIFSYYYSIPRLKTKGSITLGEITYKIEEGSSWMDHEWSGLSQKNMSANSKLSSKENSWDWICLNLSDGSDLMVFNFRKNKNESSESFGTIRSPNGKTTYFANQGDITLKSIGNTWKSDESKKKYPLHWEIRSIDMEILIEPSFENQEFNAIRSTGNIYWEGSIKAKGKMNGKEITGVGYLELKGL